MNTENRRTNKPHKFVPNFLQRLDLINLNKHVALKNWYIYCTWGNINKQHKNKKLKITAAIQNHEFKLLDSSYSVSDFQDCIDYIIKKSTKY